MAYFKIAGGDGVTCEVDDSCVKLTSFTGRKNKIIPINQISGVDVKKPMPGLYSYMYFRVVGQKNGRHLMGNINDNRVEVQGQQYQVALQIQAHIAKVNSGAYSSSGMSSADEIRKLKKLVDDGIITETEFEKKKKQLLGL